MIAGRWCDCAAISDRTSHSSAQVTRAGHRSTALTVSSKARAASIPRASWATGPPATGAGSTSSGDAVDGRRDPPLGIGRDDQHRPRAALVGGDRQQPGRRRAVDVARAEAGWAAKIAAATVTGQF